MGNLCSGKAQIAFADPILNQSENRLNQEPRLNAGMFVQENLKSFSEVYKLHPKALGSGAYGEVWLCDHKFTHEVRAVKILLKEGMPQEEIDNRSVFIEVEILKSLDHPNILKVFEYFEDADRYYIVMEFCKGGDVFDKLTKLGKFTESQAATVLKQLLGGLNYLHGRKIIHRDIKPENLLLCESENPEELNIKIIDFNIATVKKVNMESTGTVDYMAPEVFKGTYDEKCDIWGVGVILYMLICGGFPFTGKDDKMTEKNIKSGAYSTVSGVWTSVSNDCKDLLKRLLTQNPQQRLNALDALSHPWIQRLTTVDFDESTYNRTLFRMKTMTKSNVFREAFTTFMVSQLSKSGETKKLEQVFNKIDENKDGVISIPELIAELKKEMSEELAEKEAGRIMKLMDVDGSGVVDYTEFLRVSIEDEVLLSKENVLKTFAYFDKDGSGTIEKEELFAWLSKGGISEEVLNDLFAEVDGDGDGNIDLSEFESLLIEKMELEE